MSINIILQKYNLLEEAHRIYNSASKGKSPSQQEDLLKGIHVHLLNDQWRHMKNKLDKAMDIECMYSTELSTTLNSSQTKCIDLHYANTVYCKSCQHYLDTILPLYESMEELKSAIKISREHNPLQL